MEVNAGAGRLPRVSVGMPAYNTEPWIAASIESIIGQSFSDLELIVSDNGSTDRTAEIAERYAQADGRVRLIRHGHNLGAYRNYNYVVDEARAPYFKWASSSDLCHPRFLAACIECLDRDPGIVLAYPRTLLFSGDPEGGDLYDDDLGLDVDDPCERFVRFYRRIGLNNLMNGVIRTDALRSAPPDKCYLGADVVMMAALTLAGRFHQVPEPLFYRRMEAATSIGLRPRHERLAHYDPNRADRMIFQDWRARLEYFRAIGGAPIALGQKLRLWRYLARATVSMRRRLWRDAVSSCRQLATRAIRFGGR